MAWEELFLGGVLGLPIDGIRWPPSGRIGFDLFHAVRARSRVRGRNPGNALRWERRTGVATRAIAASSPGSRCPIQPRERDLLPQRISRPDLPEAASEGSVPVSRISVRSITAWPEPTAGLSEQTFEKVPPGTPVGAGAAIAAVAVGGPSGTPVGAGAAIAAVAVGGPSGAPVGAGATIAAIAVGGPSGAPVRAGALEGLSPGFRGDREGEEKGGESKECFHGRWNEWVEEWTRQGAR